MTSDPTDWHQALACVSGQLVHEESLAPTLVEQQKVSGDDSGQAALANTRSQLPGG